MSKHDKRTPDNGSEAAGTKGVLIKKWFSNITTTDGKITDVGKIKINIMLTILSIVVLIVILLISGTFKLWKVPLGVIFVLLALRGKETLISKIGPLVVEFIVLLLVPSFLSGPLKKLPIDFLFINGNFVYRIVSESLRNLLLIYLIWTNLFKKNPDKKVCIVTVLLTAGYSVGISLMGEEIVITIKDFLLTGFNDLITLVKKIVDAIKSLF